MLSNYIKIAFRNMVRHKTYSVINIMGLAIGMACAILLLLFVRDELSYDKYNSKYKRIYMVKTHFKQGEKDEVFTGSSFPIGGALKDEYPIIEESVRTILGERIYFFDQKREPIGEDYVGHVDPAIFKVFDYRFIYGSPDSALDDPRSIVLSETLAKKYFGEQNPVGKTLSRNNGVDYIVKGVFKDLPKNTFRRFTALMSIYSSQEERKESNDPKKEDAVDDIDSRKSDAFLKSTSFISTYILISEGADINTIKEDYVRFRKKYIAAAADKVNADVEPIFEPLVKVHLYSIMLGPLPLFLFIVYFGSALALLVLIIACINYINIATARASKRAREVGVRKVLGADRASLIRQLLCESMLMAIISLFLALALVELFLPSFNSQSGKEITYSVFGEPAVFAGLIALTLIVGLAAGSYPAFFLSSLQPASIVKGNPHAGKGRGRLRKILVVTQFSISIIIITLTILSREGLNYIKTMDLGFNKDNIIVINPKDPKTNRLLENLKNELRANNNISGVARSNNVAGYGIFRTFAKIEDRKGELIEKTVEYLSADSDFINLMGFKLLKGRSFNTNTVADQTGVFLVNETLVKEMGWTDSPIGKQIQYYVGNDKRIDGMIIGVLKDFIFIPFYKTAPMVIVPAENKDIVNPDWLSFLSIKIRPENSAETIEFIKRKWVELNPTYPFEYKFLNDFMNNMFETGDKMNQTLIYFSVLGIFVSCLGLFGLSAFVAESRIKEIGVRKVFGATVGSIVFKLSYDFLKLIIISCVIALPIAYFAMLKWGELFPFKGKSSWWLLLLSAGIAFVIALATISYHAVKAALTDPVKALRYE
jgi:putative ABC transport system permease protein